MIKPRLLTTLFMVLSTGICVCMLFVAAPITSAAPIPSPCGEVDTHGTIPYTPNANKIERCFWQATHTCANKTLTFHMMGVDTGSTRQFWITPACQIHESLYTYLVPAFHHFTADISCDYARFFSDGLHILGCKGDPSIIIPYQ